jgi:protein-S-isoprenylcysteine O-methyltransferase Ste14
MKGLLNMWLAAKIIGFTILVPGIETLLIPSLLSNGLLFGSIGSAYGWHLFGWLFVSLGIILYILSATGFAVRGIGTPAPIDPPKRLVVKGLHSLTRNPMYVAIISFVFGLAVISGLLSVFFYSAALFMFFHLVVIFSEEPTLRKKYSIEYEDYCQSVPRWWFCVRPYSSGRLTQDR